MLSKTRSKKVCKNKNDKKSMKKEPKVGVAMCSDWSYNSQASSASSHSLSDIMCSRFMFKDDKLQSASFISKNCILSKKDAEQMRNGFKFYRLIDAITAKFRNKKLNQTGKQIIDHLNTEVKKVDKPNRVIFALMTFNTRKKSLLDKLVKEDDDDIHILIDKYKVKVSDVIQILVKNSEFKKSSDFKKLICSFIHYYLLINQSKLSTNDITVLKKQCPNIEFILKKELSAHTHQK